MPTPKLIQDDGRGARDGQNEPAGMKPYLRRPQLDCPPEKPCEQERGQRVSWVPWVALINVVVVGILAKDQAGGNYLTHDCQLPVAVLPHLILREDA